MNLLPVDAEDTVAALLQEFHNLDPAARIVPVFRLDRTLRRNADVRFLDPARRGEVEARRKIRRIDVQDVSGRPVQPDVTEIDRLVIDVAPEEEPHVITGVRTIIYSLVRADEGDFRVLAADKRGDMRRHDADEPASVFELKAFDIAEPADRIPDGADRELDHDLPVFGIVVVCEKRLRAAFRVDLEPEPDEEFLHTGHKRPRNCVGAVQDDAGV